METKKLSNNEIDEQIELFTNRIETISEYISDYSNDFTVKQVLLNQKEGYIQSLNQLMQEKKDRQNLLIQEKKEKQINAASNFESCIEINPLGSMWIGKSNTAKNELVFLILYPHNILKYSNTDSTWKIENNKLILSINNGFATYYGQIKNGRFFGNAVNVQEQEWSFDFTLVKSNEILDYLVPKNDEEKRVKTFSAEKNLSSLGNKWVLNHHSNDDLNKNYIEFSKDGILKFDNTNQKWSLINGRYIFKHADTEYNCEFIQNKLVGFAKNEIGKEWVFSGEMNSVITIPINGKRLKIKTENRGFGLMASTNEVWNKFKLLDNGHFYEDDDYIILTCVTGLELKASKGELPWEATMYNRNIDEDKKYYEIFHGRIPDGGQFLIYRSKTNYQKNEFMIGVLNVKHDGITFDLF